MPPLPKAIYKVISPPKVEERKMKSFSPIAANVRDKPFVMLSGMLGSDYGIIKVSECGNADYPWKAAHVMESAANFFSMLSELLCSSGGIIKLPQPRN